MTISKYAKLNCDIMESRWYRKSPPGVRLCWHYLILHVKAFGLGGTFRPLDVERFAETWHVEEADVEQMIERAKDSNALRCDSDAGVWELTGWGQHQGDQTGAERQRRYREKLKTEPKESVDRNDRNALRPSRNTEEKRREEKRGEDSSSLLSSCDDHTPAIIPNRFDPEPAWERFRELYPRRKGNLNFPKGKEIFRRIAASEEKANAILGGVVRYRSWCDREGKTGTEYVQMVTSWLNQRRWEDEIGDGLTAVDRLASERDAILREQGIL